MIDVREKNPRKKNPRRADTSGDAWRDWKPQWTRNNTTPHDHQERHSPTRPVLLRSTHDRTTQRSARRLVDARLWDSLTVPQQDAALEIAAAAHLASRGAGFRTSPPSMQRLGSGPGGETERQAAMIAFYFSWATEAKREKIAQALILDILLFGKSCRQVDRERKLRNGTARGLLVEGLKLYCKLKGWPV